MPRWGILEVARFWARTNLWLLRVVCGIEVEFRGLEKIPPGPLLVASKHQSLWETFALLPLLSDPAYIMKRELMWIPFFGWYAWKAGMIPVDRGKGSQALAEMNACARAGAGARPPDHHLSRKARAGRPAPSRDTSTASRISMPRRASPCLPIALNSGLFWPRRSLRRYPGTILVEVLDPIPPGLGKEAFFERLQRDIEAATARLVAEGERELAATGSSAAPLGAVALDGRSGGVACALASCVPLSRSRQQMQLGLAIAELLQRRDGRDDIVAVGAGLAVALPHVVQLLLER